MSREDLAAAIGQGVLGYYLGALGVTLVLLARDFDVDVLSLGWLSNGFGVSLVVVGVLGSAVLRLGAARVLKVVVGLIGVGGVLLALGPGLAPAQAGAIALGAGGAGVVLCTPAMVVGERMAQRLTMVSAASSVTGVVAPLLLGGAEVVAGNGRLALLVPLPAVVALAFMRVSAPTFGPTRRFDSSRLGVVIRGWSAMVLGIAAEFGFLLWGAARLIDVGLSEAQAALGAAAFPVGMAVARLVGARSAGHHRALGLACGATIAGAVLIAAFSTPVMIVIGLGIGGVGAAFLYPLTLAALVGASGLPTRTVAPIATTASGVAVLAGPALFRLVARSGGLELGFLVLVPLAIAVMLIVPRSVPRSAEHREHPTVISG